MKINKMAMVALVTTGLSLGMVACSSEDDDVNGQDQTTVSESVTEDSDDLDHDDEGEDEDDDTPAPPTEVTGFINDEIEHVAEYHEIPIEYLNGVLDGSIPSDSNYIGDGMGPTYYYDSVDLVMMVGTDGEVKELSPANGALGYQDKFTPREGIYDQRSSEDEGVYPGYDLYYGDG